MNFYTKITHQTIHDSNNLHRKHLNVLLNWFSNIFQSAAAQESCHQTSSPRLLPVLPWLEVSSLRYAATRGNVDPQWRNPNLPETAKFYIVLLYRTQKSIQKLMITGPCKFQTHLSWSESLILTSRSRKKHSLCTSLSCQEGEHLFQTGIKVTDSPEICWIYHELPWATKLAVTGEMRCLGEQTKDLPNGMLPSASKSVMQFVTVCANKMDSQIQVSWLTLTLFTQNLNLLIPLKTTEIS